MGIKATFFRVFQLTCCKATEEASPLWRVMAEKAEKRQKCTHFANLRGLMPYLIPVYTKYGSKNRKFRKMLRDI
jgi:hypothetical protein